MSFRFFWDKVYIKRITSMLIGISPELELALYTLCFRARPGDDCKVILAGDEFTIKTVIYNNKLRNAFFQLLPN